MSQEEMGTEGISINESNEILVIEDNIKNILSCREQITQILAWDDITSEDRQRIDELEKLIETKLAEVRKNIDSQFDLLFVEISSAREIVSASNPARVYRAEDLIATIKSIRKNVENDEAYNINYITSTNNIRKRVTVLLKLITELKKV